MTESRDIVLSGGPLPEQTPPVAETESLAATAASVPSGSVVVLRDATDTRAMNTLLKSAGKTCPVLVDTRATRRASWWTQYTGAK